MSKVLVTGGAGYIGSMLVELLLKENHDVTVLDNFMYNQATLLDSCVNPRFKVVRADVTNVPLMKSFYEKNKFDYVIPLACLTGAPICSYNPKYAYDVVVDSLDMLLNSQKEAKFIYPNTNSGYGVGTSVECTEDSVLNPISIYGKIKCFAEKKIMDRGNAVSFRLATAFGVSRRMRMDLLVNDLVYRAMHDGCLTIFEGHFRRNFIHVRDIANAFVFAINNFERMKGEVYNLGLTSANISKLELANKIAEQVTRCKVIEVAGKEDPDKRDYIVSNAKLESMGWRADYSLEEGIRELTTAYQIIKRNQHGNI